MSEQPLKSKLSTLFGMRRMSKPLPGHEGELRSAYLSEAAAARSYPGCLLYAAHVQRKWAGEFSIWTSEDARERFLSDHAALIAYTASLTDGAETRFPLRPLTETQAGLDWLQGVLPDRWDDVVGTIFVDRHIYEPRAGHERRLLDAVIAESHAFRANDDIAAALVSSDDECDCRVEQFIFCLDESAYSRASGSSQVRACRERVYQHLARDPSAGSYWVLASPEWNRDPDMLTRWGIELHG